MHTDLSAAFAHAPLPERLRHLAQLAEEAEVAAPDVYGEAPGLQRFEAEVAELLGKEAGVFFSTGTLAQRAALHVHTEQLKAPKGRVIVHPSSHLVHHDCLRDGQAQSKRVRTEVSTRLPTFVVEFAGDLQRPLALTDLIGPQSAGVLEGDVVVVELPQRMNGGRTMAWADIQQLSKLAKDVGARMHMDGARLWEVQPFYGCSLRDVCTLFDSVYVSFYKGTAHSARGKRVHFRTAVARCPCAALRVHAGRFRTAIQKTPRSGPCSVRRQHGQANRAFRASNTRGLSCSCILAGFRGGSRGGTCTCL